MTEHQKTALLRVYADQEAQLAELMKPPAPAPASQPSEPEAHASTAPPVRRAPAQWSAQAPSGAHAITMQNCASRVNTVPPQALSDRSMRATLAECLGSDGWM